MEWFKGFPEKPGLYMRSNPPIQSIVRENLYEAEGELWVICNETYNRKVRELPHFGNRFWWFGPIPDFPGKHK